MRNEVIKKYGIAILIAAGLLILGISRTYAYFVTRILSEPDGGPDFIASASTSSNNITLNTIRSINNADRRPGYQDVMAFSVTTSSNVAFDINMEAVSTIETPISYMVYRTSSNVNVSNSCENINDEVNSQYSESCTITNINSLGSLVAGGTITSNTSSYVLLSEHALNASTEYYYIVFSYPNTDSTQDRDFRKALNVTVEVEEVDANAQVEYVTYSLTYEGIPQANANELNITNQSVEKGTSVTITDAKVEGYRLNEIRITGNDTTTFPVETGYNFSKMNIALDIDATIVMSYVETIEETSETEDDGGEKDPPPFRKAPKGEGTPLAGPPKPDDDDIYNGLNDDGHDDRYDFEMISNSEGPLTIIFDVSSKANVGDIATLWHYKKSTHKWENLGSQIVNESLEATWVISSFSPFSIAVKHNNSSSGSKTLVQKALEDNNALEEASVPQRISFDDTFDGEVAYEVSVSNPHKVCTYRGQRVYDFTTINTSNMSADYIDSDDCTNTKICKVIINGQVGYFGNITEQECTATGQQLGFAVDYKQEYASLTYNEYCDYDGYQVFDFSTFNPNTMTMEFANESTCHSTPLCFVQDIGPVVGADETTCTNVGLAYSYETEYINDYATWKNRISRTIQETRYRYETFYKTNNAEHGDTVYYYSGNATNNWVIFGTCKNSNWNCTLGDDLYWRIIRTNEESTGGGVRLLYAGSGSATKYGHQSIATVTNGVITTDTHYNAGTFSGNSRTDKYVGYMYGDSGYEYVNIRENTEQSNIKGVVDRWYNATFTESNLKSKISTTAVYCNDRSYTNSQWYSLGSSINQFGAYGRLFSSKSPSYACGTNSSGYNNYFTGGNNKTDRFSAEETTYGNGKLKDTNGNPVPVALMTADEIVFAGGKYSTYLSSPYAWYYRNAGTGSATGTNYWWTMSPSFAGYTSDIGTRAYVMHVESYGLLHEYETDVMIAVRPVLSLKSNVQWASGDGTPDNPYRIVEN